MHVPVTGRHLFLIARDQPGLWDYLRREFSSEENVEVILYRRLGRDRRSRPDRRAVPRLVGSTARGRPIAAQRTTAPVGPHLRPAGYAVSRRSPMTAAP